MDLLNSTLSLLSLNSPSGIVVILGAIALLVAVIFGIVALVKHMKNKAQMAKSGPRRMGNLDDFDSPLEKPLNQLVGNEYGKLEAGFTANDFLSIDPATGEYRHDTLGAFPSLGNTKGGPSRLPIDDRLVVPNVLQMKFPPAFHSTADTDLKEELPKDAAQRSAIDAKQRERNKLRLFKPAHRMEAENIAKVERSIFTLRPPT
jgi:hypothetical protein